jgi:TPR repeat protein
MKGVWQAATVWTFCLACVHAAEKPSEFGINPPKVVKSMFSQDLGMLDPEREEYATNLAAYAANQVAAAKASPKSLENARRFLGLALHLSPRNKKAIVVGFQLSKGIVPEVTEGNYTPQAFSRLLLTRGQLLEKQGGEENKRLARHFIQLAAELDPRNEDAVYASEVHRLDQGEVDWSAITDAPGHKP